MRVPLVTMLVRIRLGPLQCCANPASLPPSLSPSLPPPSLPFLQGCCPQEQPAPPTSANQTVRPLALVLENHLTLQNLLYLCATLIPLNPEGLRGMQVLVFLDHMLPLFLKHLPPNLTGFSFSLLKSIVKGCEPITKLAPPFPLNPLLTMLVHVSVQPHKCPWALTRDNTVPIQVPKQIQNGGDSVWRTGALSQGCCFLASFPGFITFRRSSLLRLNTITPGNEASCFLRFIPPPSLPPTSAGPMPGVSFWQPGSRRRKGEGPLPLTPAARPRPRRIAYLRLLSLLARPPSRRYV